MRARDVTGEIALASVGIEDVDALFSASRLSTLATLSLPASTVVVAVEVATVFFSAATFGPMVVSSRKPRVPTRFVRVAMVRFLVNADTRLHCADLAGVLDGGVAD